MGTWNAGLFSNDTTLDVRDTYLGFLKQQLNNEDAYKKTYEEYEELIGTDEEPLFWYAIADTQWNTGRLMPEVKDIVLELIQEKGGISLWEELRNGAMKWEKTLQKLKEKIESPMPPEKKFAKPIVFETNPWNVGDVYAYQFHSDKAAENQLLNKYILLQKIGDAESYRETYSVVQVFDRVFDSIPSLDMIEGVRLLPMIYPPGTHGIPDDINSWPYSFENQLKAFVDYEKKRHYPKKYMTFICNIAIPQTEYSINKISELSWKDIEILIIKYYLSWQNVEY